jgi:hypothetical protein
MAHERIRAFYGKLLNFYPKPYRERFKEGMEQTFNDLLRERVQNENNIFSFTLWVFVETFVGILQQNITLLLMKNRNIFILALVTALILMIPLVAMRFTSEVNWTTSDFIFAGVLLFGTGLAYELISRRSGSSAYKCAIGIGVMTGLLLIWINGAVGIIGNENNPANLMYFGVLATGMIGAIISSLRASEMSRTLMLMAIAQMLVPVIALQFAKPEITVDPGLVGVFAINAVFSLFWLSSAVMFRRSIK